MFHLEKRIITIFTAFCLTIGCICLKLCIVSITGDELVPSETHFTAYKLYDVRGNISDCNGKRLTERDYDNVVIAKATPQSADMLSELADSKSFAEISRRIKNGFPVMFNIGSRSIISTDDFKCYRAYKRYSDSHIAQHIIGYLDSELHGISGIEKAFDDLLYIGREVYARVPSDALGRSITGGEIEIHTEASTSVTIRLTLDYDLQQTVENALDEGGITEGCAIVTDIKSGAIRAMASRPSFDADRVADYLDSEDSPLLNRCLQSYAVGSVFKVAVAAAAEEAGLENFECNCSGSCNVGGVVFGCSGNTVHGKVDLQKALEVSCNTYFISLGQKLGANKILEATGLLGFGQVNRLCDGISADEGTVPSREELKNPAALANFSFGQGSFTASVFQISQMISAIGGSGKYYEPYLVEEIIDSDGASEKHRLKYPVTAFDEKTAESMAKMLTSVVTNGNAAAAKPTSFNAAGKTATAQTGIYNSNGDELCNTWFAGFFPAENPQYTVVIMKQGGVSGAYDCAPVFKSIADKIILPN